MTPSTKASPSRPVSAWFVGTLLVAGIVLAVLLFRDGALALVTMDAPPSWFSRVHACLRAGFSTLWFIDPWLGMSYGPLFPEANLLLLAGSSYPYTAAWLAWANLLLGGIGMFVLLRGLRLTSPACAFGSLAYVFTNAAITLIYAGHMNKLMSYAWIPFSIAFFLRGMEAGRWRSFAVSGAFLGLALLGGEVQISYYIGLWYVVWFGVHAWTKQQQNSLLKKEVIRQAVGLALVAALSLGVGFSNTLHSVRYLGVNAPITGGGDTAQNWQFATQFFFPPEELLSYLITIQFFGAPQAYWGRDGSPTPLRLSDDYMGLMPLGFAILGAIVCWRIWQARLFIFMALGSLLISFGREGGLFWLLYQLPTMKSQRNPHRWSYFVSLAVCVLAAYGCNWLLSQLCSTFDVRRSTNRKAPPQSAPEDKGQEEEILLSVQNDGASSVEHRASSGPSWDLWKRALLAIALLGGALFVVTGALSLSPKSLAGFFYASDQMSSPQAPILVERARCMLVALMRTGLFLAASALATWWVIAARTVRNEKGEGKNGGILNSSLLTSHFSLRLALPWVAILAVTVADLGSNARRYIQFYPWKDVYEKNELVNFLRQDKDFYRVKVLGAQQNPLLNQLVSNVLPYHRIPVVDPIAASRIPNDYAQLFEHIQNHYTRSDRYFDFFNVKYLLSPGPFADPITPFTLVAQWNGIYVYQRPSFLPRAWLASSAVVVKEGGGASRTMPLDARRSTFDVGGEKEAAEAVIAKTMHPETDLREVVVMEEAPEAVGTVPLDARRSTLDGRQTALLHTEKGKKQTGNEKQNLQEIPHSVRNDNLSQTSVLGKNRSGKSSGASSSQETSSVERRASSNQPRTARMVSYEDNRLSVETEASIPTMLVMSEKWDPDWKAWVDGQPAKIYRANFLMRAVELTAGKHTVRMEYRPSTVGFWISAVSVGLFALYGIGCGWRKFGVR